MQENQSKKDEYYTSDGRRIGDFFIGFVGSIVLVLIAYIFTTFNRSFVSFGALSLFAPLALLILASVVSGIQGRRYIAIGIVSAIIIPLLFFGACWIVIIGTGFGG
jgi:heme/copper-type cytochrome/quinol oxidase subunit 4